MSEHWPLWRDAGLPPCPDDGRRLAALICVAELPGGGPCGLLAFTLPEATGQHPDPGVRGGCTGVAARWCEIHGDCTCPEGALTLNSYGCPLHGEHTKHGDPGLTGDVVPAAASVTTRRELLEALERSTKLDRACDAIEAGMDPVDALAELEDDGPGPT